ncbi:MAG TPA: hypothetical protein VKC60_10450, partial [Opitutaceae bacterium]|nr:hypothetical protein [Opitutaceae bacterium]
MPVTVSDDGSVYTLSNGFVSASVDKESGDLVSLKYQGLEMMGGTTGHPHGYWSHTPARGKSTAQLSIDPKSNNGARGEVSVRGKVSKGGAGGGDGLDLEIRYALGQADSGIYTYSIFTHAPDAPATQIGEARFAAKLTADLFDFMTVDARRRKLMPTSDDCEKGTELNMKEGR